MNCFSLTLPSVTLAGACARTWPCSAAIWRIFCSVSLSVLTAASLSAQQPARGQGQFVVVVLEQVALELALDLLGHLLGPPVEDLLGLRRVAEFVEEESGLETVLPRFLQPLGQREQVRVRLHEPQILR